MNALIFWAKDEKDMHDLAIKLREAGVDLEQEDDAAGFLGVTLEQNIKLDWLRCVKVDWLSVLLNHLDYMI